MKGLFKLLLGLGLVFVASSYHLKTREHPISIDLSDTEKLIGEDDVDDDQIQIPNGQNAMTESEENEGIDDDQSESK